MLDRLRFLALCEGKGFPAMRYFFGEHHGDLIAAGYARPDEYRIKGRFIYNCLWLTDAGRAQLSI